MYQESTGSELTRAMLDGGDKQIWCAVSDDSDKEAMSDQINNDFTARIVSFDNEHFLCTAGMTWLFAIPIKIVPLKQDEVGL